MGSKGKAKYEQYRILAKEKNLSDYRVSKDVGIAQETLSSWKKGKYVPKTDKLQLLADYFGVDVDYFYTDKVIERISDGRLESSINKIKDLYEVSAGTGRSCSCPSEFKQEDGKFARVVGDSMYPILLDGDVVRIVEASTVEPTDIALVKVNGDENTLKFVEITSDGVWIRAENKAVFDDRFFTMQEVLTIPVQIVGKAVELVSRKL